MLTENLSLGSSRGFVMSVCPNEAYKEAGDTAIKESIFLSFDWIDQHTLLATSKGTRPTARLVDNGWVSKFINFVREVW
jgi:hypothetical protein